MKNCHNTDIEGQTVAELLTFIQSHFLESPVGAVVGALMRTSFALVVEALGEDLGQKTARRALENIISQQKRRKLQ
ncbi:hypothetical protein H2508_04585 [Parahaliea sp. F7430]|uniref:Uncharacterized protein n=1 Tax=Sediminihaliea albiluteola TaxID=2758564 RepID=A0A7W2YJJ8_9GAMM|nr:hypothetical protein [Sediminihaliea albiluteola]MBA6412383.1 hypothetical protein [Sediminihaliea albiluteola]